MKKYTYFRLAILLLGVLSQFGCNKKGTGPGENQNLALSGPYLGQQPPGDTPVAFAPGIVSTDNDWGITFSPDGRECFFTRTLDRPTIMSLREENGNWTTPETASFSGTHSDIEPHITPDGNFLYFGSERPLPGGGPSGLHQWQMEKSGPGWSEPRPMDPPLRDIFMMYPSVANNGNIYFTASDGTDQWIAVSRFYDDAYQAPQRLSDNINSLELTAHPFIAPDESYLIFDAVTRIQNNQYICDLFISFRNLDGTWRESVNMGEMINTDAHECCAFVSRDHAYLFFSRESNIYWCDAQVIDDLRSSD